MNQHVERGNGREQLTPLETANRPGLSTLAYRAGTHSSFLETMKAALSNQEFSALAGLTTREAADPAIALLDAWAMIADVLTFYQERIANEGYLRTAVERRSILELARLVDYRPRPGVAASTYFAYTLEKDSEVTIPVGSRAQSVPGPNELPQSFETSEPLPARAAWNNLVPRQTKPQVVERKTSVLYFKGITTNLKPNDPILCAFPDKPELRYAKEVTPEPDKNRTRVTFQEPVPPGSKLPIGGTLELDKNSTQVTHQDLTPKSPEHVPPGIAAPPPSPIEKLMELMPSLSKLPAEYPATSLQLKRSMRNALSLHSDMTPSLLSTLHPQLGSQLYDALGKTRFSEESGVRVYVFRVAASVFGCNAPLRPTFNENKAMTGSGEWPLAEKPEQEQVLHLDAAYHQIIRGSWVVTVKDDPEIPIIATVKSAVTTSKAAYGLSGRVTQLTLDKPWLSEKAVMLSDIRTVSVYAQSEELELAEEPIEEPICGDRIELDGLYSGLESGRLLIVEGERTDIKNTPGMHAAELVMLDGVEHHMPNLPGDMAHSFLRLVQGLAYCYKRNTVTIHGNVVQAMHGETKADVLGSGDAAKRLHEFPLRQSPLTYVPSPTPEGVKSTLELRVNDILWDEVETLVTHGPNDRVYVTRTDDDAKTSVVTGNGICGARPPTGIENVKAVYRTGIGKYGNVCAQQISLLSSRPLGVKGVINPLVASGGADRESRDQARRNAPLGVKSLDRLVSVQDYADFARTFAGIGKASAKRLSDGHRHIVHLTIAGLDDMAIDRNSTLYRNFTSALAKLGDPGQPTQVDLREGMLIVISANVRLLDDYLWNVEAPKIRAALLDAFSFERRELGQNVFLSEVLAVIQMMESVAYVDVDRFGAIDKTCIPHDVGLNDRILVRLAGLGRDKTQLNKGIRPAQIAFLSPNVPDTLILNALN